MKILTTIVSLIALVVPLPAQSPLEVAPASQWVSLRQEVESRHHAWQQQDQQVSDCLASESCKSLATEAAQAERALTEFEHAREKMLAELLRSAPASSTIDAPAAAGLLAVIDAIAKQHRLDSTRHYATSRRPGSPGEKADPIFEAERRKAEAADAALAKLRAENQARLEEMRKALNELPPLERILSESTASFAERMTKTGKSWVDFHRSFYSTIMGTPTAHSVGTVTVAPTTVKPRVVK